MIGDLKTKVRFRALVASILVHGGALVVLGVGPLHGTTAENGRLVVCLTTVSAMPERVSSVLANPDHETVSETVQVRSLSHVESTPPELVPQVPADPVVSMEKQGEDSGFEAPADVSRKDFSQVAGEDPARGTTGTEVGEKARELGRAKGPVDEVSATDRRVLPVDSQSSIFHSPSGSPLLAFAGDPVASGIIPLPGPEALEVRILSMPEPVYPVLSRKRGEEGKVVVRVEVNPQGAVVRAQVQSSSSFPRLDRAAVEAVRRARFAPATENGLPVIGEMLVAYRFRLNDEYESKQ